MLVGIESSLEVDASLDGGIVSNTALSVSQVFLVDSLETGESLSSWLLDTISVVLSILILG